MYKKLSLLVVCLFAQMANAGQSFSCAGAQIDIQVVKIDEDDVDSAITVTKDGRSTVLRHTQIDRIGGICLETQAKKQFIVYQAVCGGSGCKTIDNWGIIDSEDLRVLLAPNDTNRSEAIKILGKEPRIESYLDIEKEKIKLGVKLR